MEIIGTATKVTVYIGESDRWGGKPLYMAILELLKTADCAGATVTRGLAGFGSHSRIRTAGIVDLSPDLPLVVEWVDDPARVERVMPQLIEMVAEGMITVSPVEVLSYGHRELRRLPASAPVRDLMSREVRAVRPDLPLAAAVEMLVGGSFRALPVIDDERRVIGILTDGDLLRRLGLPDAGVQAALTRAEIGRELDALRHSGQTVGEWMVTPAITTTAETPVAQAVKVMAERGVKRLPVVDPSGRLVGVVSRVDVLRALAQPPAGEAAGPGLQPGRYGRVRDVMSPPAPTVRADAGMDKVVDLMAAAAARRVVVIDATGRAVGIITDGDVIRQANAAERTGLIGALMRRGAGANGLNLGKGTAGAVMTADPLTVGPETPLLEALQLLLRRKIKRLPVVDADGRPVGLVGRGEILQALAMDLAES